MSRARRSGETVASVQSGRGLGMVLLLALAVVLADQVTKVWVDSVMGLHQSIPVVAGFIDLTYVRNTGGAFSLLADAPATLRLPLFVTVALSAIGGLLWYVRTLPPGDLLSRLACGLVLGGAVGNLIDRVLEGSVVDFVDVYVGTWHWPAWNVADAGISVGVVLLLFRSFRP